MGEERGDRVPHPAKQSDHDRNSRGDGEGIRLDEGIVLFWAIDLNVGNIGQRVSQIEVFRLSRRRIHRY